MANWPKKLCATLSIHAMWIQLLSMPYQASAGPIIDPMEISVTQLQVNNAAAASATAEKSTMEELGLLTNKFLEINEKIFGTKDEKIREYGDKQTHTKRLTEEQKQNHQARLNFVEQVKNSPELQRQYREIVANQIKYTAIMDYRARVINPIERKEKKEGGTKTPEKKPFPFLTVVEKDITNKKDFDIYSDNIFPEQIYKRQLGEVILLDIKITNKEEYDKAIAFDPNQIKAHTHKGIFIQMRRDFQAADKVEADKWFFAKDFYFWTNPAQNRDITHLVYEIKLVKKQMYELLIKAKKEGIDQNVLFQTLINYTRQVYLAFYDLRDQFWAVKDH